MKAFFNTIGWIGLVWSCSGQSTLALALFHAPTIGVHLEQQDSNLKAVDTLGASSELFFELEKECSSEEESERRCKPVYSLNNIASCVYAFSSQQLLQCYKWHGLERRCVCLLLCVLRI